MDYKFSATPKGQKILAVPDKDFAQSGIEHVVYIKPIKIDGRCLFAIFAANGAPKAIAKDYNNAMAFAVRDDFIPLSLH